MKQYLEHIKGKSSKFWEIELDGQYLKIQSGKIGGKAKLTEKDLKTKEKAFLTFKREIIKKKKGGYVDPKQPIVSLPLEDTPFNDATFKHGTEVETIHYYAKKERVITASRDCFYLWKPNGELLDCYRFSDDAYFFGKIFIKEIPNSDQVLIYKKKTYRSNHFYLFDCTNDQLELIKEEEIKIPIEGYYGDLDLDENYLYLGYTGGFMVLNYDLEIIKTLASPQPHDNSSGVAVNATSQRIAFVQYGGRGELDKALIVDFDGNKIAEFETKAHGGSGMMAQFNVAGTTFYAASSSNYETKVQLWDVEKGVLEKELINYSSSGGVLSFSISEDNQWIAIRVAGIDVILWNAIEAVVAWVKTNEALSAELAFGDSDMMYQSSGNRIYPIRLETGEKCLDIKGLTEECRNLYFDDVAQQLWVLSGKAANCFALDGTIDYSMDIQAFIAGKISGKMLIKRRYQNFGGSYAWLDLKTKEEIPFRSGMFKDIDFNDKYLISTSGYFSREKKLTRLWSTKSGKMLKEFKPSKDLDVYFWNEEQFITKGGKKIEWWSMDEKKPFLTIKNAHSREVTGMVVAQERQLVFSYAHNEIKLWDGKSDQPLFFDLLEGNVKKVIVKSYLPTLLIVTEIGGIYTFDLASKKLNQIAAIDAGITEATLNNRGDLYVATVDLEILTVNLSSHLSIQIIEKNVIKIPAIDLRSLGEAASEATLLEFMDRIPWENLTAEVFLKLRSLLETLELEKGAVGAAHHAFTARLLEQGALLKHEFAHEEESGSFAMSPDGAYLAVGTWVGDNYGEDGTVQIWELSTGRCVNLLKENYGGVGWPDYPNMLQWSTNSQYLGVGLNTNSVVKLNPFSSSSSPLASASITNGWSRPPAWAWQGEQDAFVISCWHRSEIPVGITSNKKLNSYEDDAKWLATKLSPSFVSMLDGDDLQPYKWCSATPDGQLVYGYNGHGQVYAIDVEQKQLVWLKLMTNPIAFSTGGNFMVYPVSDQLILANLKTGEQEATNSCSLKIQGIELATDGQRYAAYSTSAIVIYDYDQELGQINLTTEIRRQNQSDSELSSFQFNLSGTQVAVLLKNKKIQIWSLEKMNLLQEFDSTAEGIYWGLSLVGVGRNELSFYKEDGTLMRCCDKGEQVEAYNELYDKEKLLQIGKKDLTANYELDPNYPLYHENGKEWLVATPAGLVLTSSPIAVETLDQHLSYTYQDKYAWPYCWGGSDAVYTSLYDAKEDAKLGLTKKEKALIKAPKAAKKKRGGIDFTKGGTLLDIINVHQKSLSNLTSGWHYHISTHNGIIARKLVELEEYKKAIKVAKASPEWYVLVANLGFLAVDLVKKGAEDFARIAFDAGVEALEKKPTTDRNGWAATFVYAPLAAAAKLLGMDERATEYFQLSYQKLEEESNTFEKYTRLATCYLLCDEYEKAMEVMIDGPWSNGWFVSYQVQFVLLLMNVDQLDLAIQYFDLGIEKCGKIDEFDLLDKGFAILLEQKNYKEAIAWLERFPGLSTRHCEELLIDKYIQENEKELATDFLLKEMEKSAGYDGSLITYLRLMSRINPVEATKRIKDFSAVTNAYYKDRYYEDLGRAKSNLGLLEDAFDVANEIGSISNKVRYLIGLLDCLAKDQSKQIEVLKRVIELLSSEDIASKEKMELYLKLYKATLIFDLKETSTLLLAQTKDLMINSKDSSNYTELQNLYLELDLLEESYAVFKKQTPKNRKYEMKDYAFSIAGKGYWKTAAALLETITATDLNDRPAAAMKIIEGF